MEVKNELKDTNLTELTDWLLEGPPWVQYRTRIDLLGQAETDQEVIAARKAMLADPQVQALLKELAEWPGVPLKRHNDAGHPLHKLTFLADLGLQASDPALKPVIERILNHQSQEGAFQIIVNIPTHFGGSGEDEWQWMLCDAPSTLYALHKFGLGTDPCVQTASSHIGSLVRENGWPCAAASELGKFRGPGRVGDPCPYANLISLKALAQSSEWRDGETCKVGAETILSLWEQRKERKPYLFGMGTDFAKLKAPLIWYDILHVLDVLSQFPWLKTDSRLREMAGLVKAKADAFGRFMPESIWMAWKGWEFAQKKEPSRWITLIAQRAFQRLGA
ncbi:MAG: hypothetical protein JW963_09775 [Anaerolineales bacterium]|nr:hypothetical protein [Anaerolineales bacterium]